MGPLQADSPESFDIVIVGAGLAGINCAYRLQTRLPNAKITLLEARGTIGGTWELFQYPGIRSDSDLYTYGFAWEPWPYDNPIAEGHLILSYLHHCVNKYGLRKYMQFRHKVVGAHWSSESKRWTLTVDHDGGSIKTIDASFVVLSTGYFDYDNPLPASIPGMGRFQGTVLHPQFWPSHYDFTDKDVVVIGSGATAITLLPNLAKQAKHITMLQRSPGYIVSMTNRGPFHGWWALPAGLRSWLNWLYASTVPHVMVYLCALFPERARTRLLQATRKALPAHIGLAPHFTPRYHPWEQRLCLSPDGDFFRCLHGSAGQLAKADVVTATIETVTADGIACMDGQHLKTDVIVTATGLKMIFGGGIPLRVDGELIDPHDHAIWDGCMLDRVPNLVFMAGYARASWTVGVDNTAITLIRLWKEMKAQGKLVAVPTLPAHRRVQEEDKRPYLDLPTATYIRKDTAYPYSIAWGKGPWKARGNIWADWIYARWGAVGKSMALS